MSAISVVDAAKELEEKLPAGTVLRADEDLDRYTADTFWRSLHAKAAGEPLGRPDVVVVPRSEDDVVTAVKVAASHRIPVTAWGGGSGTQGASVPTRGGIVVDLRGIDEVIEVDEESMTVTVQAGKNGRELESELNAKGLMLPHYPASVEWATVGGYIAARGSGVLSTRYGKIEDIVISMRVVTPAGLVTDMLPVNRHAAGPELTQLYVGAEGTLGIITRATLQLAPLPEKRRFEAVLFPDVPSGVDAIRRALQAGYRPSVVRLYDPTATKTTFAPVVGDLEGVSCVLAFEGPEALADLEAEQTLAFCRAAGAEQLDPEIGQIWWDHRYDFYEPPHHPELPSVWGTIDVVATYARIQDCYDALIRAVAEPYADQGLVLKQHYSHWYQWGTMIYARFLIKDGAENPVELHDEIWRAGVEAVLEAGGVLNDHHGVGLKLAPFMQQQYGATFDTLQRVKDALDPNHIMNPGKLGFAEPAA